MRKIALLAVVACMIPGLGLAQPSSSDPLDGTKLFRTQCSTCHTLKASEPKRQGPNLEHVYGRKIGAVEDYKYTPGYRESNETWTAENLDKYLTNPSAIFPGSTMAYRQNKPEVRKAIIEYLKEQG